MVYIALYSFETLLGLFLQFRDSIFINNKKMFFLIINIKVFPFIY